MKVPVHSHVLRKLSGLQDRLKQVFRAVVRRNRHPEEVFSYSSFVPLANIYTDSEKLVYEIEIPGMDRANLDVTLDGNLLVVRGERKFGRDERRGNWLWKESFQGALRTSYVLPDWVDSDSIRAEYRKGLLRIELDKKSWARTRRIPISRGSVAALNKAA